MDLKYLKGISTRLKIGICIISGDFQPVGNIWNGVCIILGDFQPVNILGEFQPNRIGVLEGNFNPLELEYLKGILTHRNLYYFRGFSTRRWNLELVLFLGSFNPSNLNLYYFRGFSTRLKFEFDSKFEF